MATLTLTLGASADDANQDDLSYDDTLTAFNVGEVNSAGADTGQGWRFTNVTLVGADTINSAEIRLMKSTTQWITCNHRWTCVNQDNTATFSSGSKPGSRAIVATIVAETHNENHTDGTVYAHPLASGDKTTFGAAVGAVLDRAGWASGNALAVVNQSNQDGSQGEGTLRELYHTYDSSTASSEPQLVIDYTAFVSLEQEGFRFRKDDGSETTATWEANQDVNLTKGTGTNFRLRVLLNATGDPASITPQLDFRVAGSSDPWVKVPLA